MFDPSTKFKEHFFEKVSNILLPKKMTVAQIINNNEFNKNK